MSKLGLGPIGVTLNVSADDRYLGEAAELEELGYAAIWLPGGQLDRLERIAKIARDRAAGAIPLLVTPAYTSAARRILGDEATLIIDQMIVLDTDATRAREIARRPLQFLSGISGYRANFARMGFTGTDIDGLTDRLVDELVAWGDAGPIAARISEHRQAGADQVVLHILNSGHDLAPIQVARQLASTLFS